MSEQILYWTPCATCSGEGRLACKGHPQQMQWPTLGLQHFSGTAQATQPQWFRGALTDDEIERIAQRVAALLRDAQA